MASMQRTNPEEQTKYLIKLNKWVQCIPNSDLCISVSWNFHETQKGEKVLVLGSCFWILLFLLFGEGKNKKILGWVHGENSRSGYPDLESKILKQDQEGMMKVQVGMGMGTGKLVMGWCWKFLCTKQKKEKGIGE